MPSISNLSVQLRGDPVSEAFHKVTQSGCNHDDLKRWLTKLQAQSEIYPLSRARSYFPLERRRKLEQVAADLEHAASQLGGEAGVWIFILGDLQSDILGSMQPAEALAILRKVALLTRNAVGRVGGVKRGTASDPIASIMKLVKNRTGRPHYEEMATLIGAAFGKPEFSAGELKMLVHRRDSRHKKVTLSR